MPEAKVKCLVWDLDETLWEGTLLEGGAQALSPHAKETIQELDNRGILQSIASKNDHSIAWPRLQEFEIADYFLDPRIGWASKAESVKSIANQLGIGLDTIAFIDDQPIERAEVQFLLPEVRVIDAIELPELLSRPEFTPRFITPETRIRREMYRSDFARDAAADSFSGTREMFLAGLNMQMLIRPATPEDLERAHELTVRTNQLNTGGRTYSKEELEELSRSADHLLLVAELNDRFGSSGTIGLSLIELAADCWTIRMFLMSCRVLTRGVGSVLLGQILKLAKSHKVRLLAQFVPTDRNKPMFVTYKFAGFRQIGGGPDSILLEHSLDRIAAIPQHIRVLTEI